MKLIILAMMSLFLFGCSQELNDCEECVESECIEQECVEFECIEQECIVIDDKPMVMIFSAEFGPNIDKESELFANLVVDNFGYTEAKDVIMTCIAMDPNNKILDVVDKNLGNIASTTENFKQVVIFTTKNNLSWYHYTNEDTAFACLITKCSNCIILGKRVSPEVVEAYDSFVVGDIFDV